MDYSDEEIRKKVQMAIDILFKNDHFLLRVGVHERTVAHKLAEYLQNGFPEWHVDLEYNRKENDIKALKGIRECADQRATDRIYPDIIVHKRGEEKNLLVIEIKTTGDEELCDIKKLELLTAQVGRYHYKLGLYIGFHGLANPPELRWFKNGRAV